MNKYKEEKVNYKLLANSVSGVFKTIFNINRDYDPAYIREIHRGRRVNKKVKKVIDDLLRDGK